MPMLPAPTAPPEAPPPRPDPRTLVRHAVTMAALALTLLLILTGDTQPPLERREQVYALVQAESFRAGAWMQQAFAMKLAWATLNPARLWDPAPRRDLVLAYREVIREIEALERRQQELFGDPNLSPTDRAAALQQVREELNTRYARRDDLAPVAEDIIQAQVSAVLADLGLTLGGQPIPPVWYHVSPLPWGLVVSPREVIRQDAFVTLNPHLTLEQRIAVEERVAQALNVSTLVVPVGGVGTYPTMVMQTSDLNWQIEVVAHEWLHNYFEWHPLGWNYTRDPQVRTMNETTATIAGREIGRLVVARFYPDLLPPPPPPPTPAVEDEIPGTDAAAEPVFDFNREMRITRVRVDELLAQGRVDEAEAYMEARRKVFWEHGYRIRKLNQAYFAFYGAYADSPEGGAAGQDPVGAAVRALWDRIRPDVGAFVRRMAWMGSFADLQATLAEAEGSP